MAVKGTGHQALGIRHWALGYREMVSIRRISTSDPLYEQAVALREQVLLGPVGMDIGEYRRRAPGAEERAEHFVAVLDHPTGPRVIGCAGLLVDEGESKGKLIQMAVDPQRQGEGVGRRLLAAVEARALGERGLDGLYCHAQQTAVGFYQRQGWVAQAGEFMEVGLPHRLMTLAGSPRPDPGVGRPGLDPEEPYGPQALAPQ